MVPCRPEARVSGAADRERARIDDAMTEQAGDQAPRPTDQPESGTPSSQEGAAAPETTADPWAPFDAVLQEFVTARPVGAGTLWADTPTTVVGRFVGWANAAGWPCTVRLIREQRENAVVVIVEGPPLPGGRPRQMPLGVFQAGFEAEALRVALELGYFIGETWGPREEPPSGPEAAPTSS
jgi:hypothetical protein